MRSLDITRGLSYLNCKQDIQVVWLRGSLGWINGFGDSLAYVGASHAKPVHWLLKT